MAYYMHHVPGRLRVKIRKLKSRHDQCLELERILAHCYGVLAASVNPVTGSVVVRYNSRRTNPDGILDVLKARNLFDESKVHASDKSVSHNAAELGEKVGKAVLGWAVGKALEANGLSLLAALI